MLYVVIPWHLTVSKLEHYHLGINYSVGYYKQDVLTNYFEELEHKLQYKHWFCGHYHEDFQIDDKHTILYYNILPIEGGDDLYV